MLWETITNSLSRAWKRKGAVGATWAQRENTRESPAL